MIQLAVLALSLIAFAAHGAPSVRVDLAGEWHYLPGDDLAYARPEWDDSNWGRLPLPRQTEPPRGNYWLRRHIAVPTEASGVPLALTLGAFAEVYEVWCNGIRIGDTGGTAADQVLSARPRTFNIPPSLVTSGSGLLVALRIRLPELGQGTFPRSVGALPDRGPYLLTDATNAPVDAAPLYLLLRERLVTVGFVSSALRALLMLMLLAAWLTETNRRDLLALALLLAADFTVRFFESLNVVQDASRSAFIWQARVAALSGSVLGWFALEVFRIRARWPYLAIWLPSILALMLPSARFLVGGSTVAILLLSLRQAFPPQPIERMTMALSVAALTLLHSQRVGPLRMTNLYWEAGGYLFHLYDVLSILLTAGMTLQLLLSLGADRREKERLTSEMEAARTVQNLLLTPPPASDAYQTAAVYLPATQVGGDFYWTRVEPGGALLVVVGDVSGKGLRAAMLVSVAVGILRNEKSDSPAAILGALNDGLTGHTGGGFVTCCCARFDAGGGVTIANAGHPSPYCDGREVEVAAGLPLGVVAGVAYEESLVGGERFTLVSDGVVEAENAQRELFGFDRTREISTKSAQDIAEAAQSWGQNDDITVVTVRRTA